MFHVIDLRQLSVAISHGDEFANGPPPSEFLSCQEIASWAKIYPTPLAKASPRLDCVFVWALPMLLHVAFLLFVLG